MKKKLLLEIKNMETGYGDTKIIHDVSLSIDEGEIVALMGPNGSHIPETSYTTEKKYTQPLPIL